MGPFCLCDGSDEQRVDKRFNASVMLLDHLRIALQLDMQFVVCRTEDGWIRREGEVGRCVLGKVCAQLNKRVDGFR